MEIGTSFSQNTATAAINTKTQINVASIKTQFTLNTTSKSNDVLGYYHNLCKDFPDVSFRLTDREESLKHVNEVFLGYNNSMNQVGNNFGDFGKCSIEIDVAVIRKMMSDSSFESNTKNYLNTFIEQDYPQFQATAVRDGMSNMCMNIDLEGNEIQVGATYAHCHFSTEEEIRKMWADETNQTRLNNYFNQKKSELLDTYLAMIESSETKMRTLTKETSHPSECKDFQKGRAYIHWAQTDVELQVYKTNSEDGGFTYRVDTSKSGELVNSQIIDPKSVDPRSATSEELIALDEYLCDTNQLTNNVCIRGTSMMSDYSSAKYNAYELGQSAMETQLNFSNIPSYLDYKSIIEILESLYS